jgi:hypothetical protein
MQGTTTTRVNLRKGPGTDTAIVRTLKPHTPVAILAARGDWLEVEAAGQRGFVAARFIDRAEHAVPAGLIGDPAADPFPGIDLEPPPHLKIEIGKTATEVEKTAAITWNRAGSLLDALATHLKVDPGCAVAVFGTESCGKAFGPDGRMIIRFENHHFFKFWGKENPEVFLDHFQFDSAEPWKRHLFRETPSAPFRPFHGDQANEWKVFEFARKLHDTAAKLSISMGGPQIMGSNFADAGFESVHQMFDAFASSEKRQIIAFFDFLQGPGSHPPRVRALQERDFIRFAQLYNGMGNAAEYSARISNCFEAFQRLRPVPGDVTNVA